MPKTTPIKPRRIKRETTPFYVRVPDDIRTRFPAKYPQAKRFFPNKAQAQHFCDELLAVRRTADALATGLTEAQGFEAAECFALLAERDRGMREAVDFFLAHLDATERSAEVGTLVEEFLAAKKSAGLTDEYIAPMASRLRAFAKDHPGKLASDLSAAGVESWLVATAANPVTRNNVRRNLGTLLSFATTRRYITANFIKDVPKAKEPETEIEALTLVELKALLHACDGVLLPYIAIGAFAGIRPEEITGLRWANIHFEDAEIDVPANVSKTGRRRIVLMQPVLAAWLANHHDKTGMVVPIDPRARFESTRARLAATKTLTRWPNDVLRHSYASHHLAKWEDAPKLALQMGHIDNRLIFSNYAKVVNKREAEAYWQLYPEGPLPT